MHFRGVKWNLQPICATLSNVNRNGTNEHKCIPCIPPMTSEPKVIAFSNTWHLENDATRILLHQDIYSEEKTSLFIIEYAPDTNLNNIISTDSVELSEVDYDFSELSDEVKKCIVNSVWDNDVCLLYAEWHEWYVLYCASGRCLIVTSDRVVCEIADEHSNYQSGDCSCDLFTLSNGDLLIRNSGDVQSCLLFTTGNPKVLSHEMDHDECEKLDYEICSTCCTNIQDLEMKMIDDFEFVPVEGCEF